MPSTSLPPVSTLDLDALAFQLPRSPTQSRARGYGSGLRSKRADTDKRPVYFGIKRGRIPGVYTTLLVAEAQILDYPDACLRCFSTKYAAAAYVAGWEPKGRYLPKGSPYPLFEYLLVDHSTPLHLLSPPRRRRLHTAPRPVMATINMDEFGVFPSTHDAHPSLAGSSDILTHRSSSSTLRPPTSPHRNSYRDSMVKRPSPLRHEVDEAAERPWMDRMYSSMSAGTRTPLAGLVAEAKEAGEGGTGPSTSAKEKKRGSIFGFPTFTRKQSAPASTSSSSPVSPPPPRPTLPSPSPHRDLRSSKSSPNLPRSPQRPLSTYPSSPRSPQPQRQSGLWASPPSSPLAGPSRLTPPSPGLPPKAAPAFVDSNAPAFSRAALRKSGIVMPAAATPGPRRSPSIPSLSPSSSSSSISTNSSLSSASSGSSGGSSGSRTSPYIRPQLSDFEPPRAGFMRRPSSLSISSSPSSSSESVATITSRSPTGSDDHWFDDVGYGMGALGLETTKGGRDERDGRKEKKEGMMKGFGKLFGKKKKV